MGLLDGPTIDPDGDGGGGTPSPPPPPPPEAPGDDGVAGRIRPRRDGEEKEGSGLQARVDALEAEVNALRAALSASERRLGIERALFEADAIDVEAATLLAEVALGDESGAEAVTRVVAQLRENRPYLFRSALALGAPGDPFGAGFGGSAMGAAFEGGGAGRLDDSAEAARASGDRRELLRYLRLRRGAG